MSDPKSLNKHDKRDISAYAYKVFLICWIAFLVTVNFTGTLKTFTMNIHKFIDFDRIWFPNTNFHKNIQNLLNPDHFETISDIFTQKQVILDSTYRELYNAKGNQYFEKIQSFQGRYIELPLQPISNKKYCEKYVGSFNRKAEKEGKGRLTWCSSEESILWGTWKKGKLVYGDFHSGDFMYYIGRFKNEKMHGKGQLWKKEGPSLKKTRYEGKFIDGLFHGKGTYENFDSRWKGLWRFGKFKNGIILRNNGDIIEVKDRNDVQDGQLFGVINYADEEQNLKNPTSGYVYEGFFQIKDFQPQGLGSYRKVNWETSGYFNNGIIQGEAMQTFFEKSKYIYIGNLINGLKNGKGKIYFSDGSCLESYWKNDIIDESVSSIYHSKSKTPVSNFIPAVYKYVGYIKFNRNELKEPGAHNKAVLKHGWGILTFSKDVKGEKTHQNKTIDIRLGGYWENNI